MEPPTVTNSSSNGSEKTRRQNTADYLQIDPSSTFINNTARNGVFEELPENFLDTISPHQTTPRSNSGSGPLTADSPTNTPQLAPLAPMNISNDQPSSSYSGMISNHSQYSSHIEKFNNSPAGLLSPLHIDRRQRNSHDFGSGQGYIKEEVDLDAGSHLLMTSITQQQQEMERMTQAETPPAVSNVELATTMIASLIGNESHLQNEESPSPHNYNDQSSILQQQLIKDESEEDLNLYSTKRLGSSHQLNGDEPHALDFHAKHYGRGNLINQASSSSQSPSIHVRRVYSTQDSNDPLNAEIDDDIYIDTKDLCKRIAFELKQHSIPQAIFAERILCRSQGTLSDLLRNPKPWNKLKSGRETFRRMYNWLRQPLSTRLAILDMKSEGEDISRVSGMSPPTPAQNVRQQRKSTSDPDAPSSKRPRLVFTDIQKRTLQAIFKETQRPSREMQQTIAEHLRLDLSTVANFFMNARRRSRIGPNSDEPAPYQQVRSITPPPDASPNQNGGEDQQLVHQSVIDQMALYKDSLDNEVGGVEDDSVYEHDLDESRESTTADESESITNENNEKEENGKIEKDESIENDDEEGPIVKEETPDDGEYEKSGAGGAVKSH